MKKKQKINLKLKKNRNKHLKKYIKLNKMSLIYKIKKNNAL